MMGLLFESQNPNELIAVGEGTQNESMVQWHRTYGGTSGDEAPDLVSTTDGGFALAGSTGSLGAYGSEMWLVKTDANGVEEWSRTYGGFDSDWASALVQTDDGGFALAGLTRSFGVGGGDVWLVKTDSDGVLQWDQTYGRWGAEGASSLIQTLDGGFAIAGYTTSYGAGDFDMFLVKTDKDGNEEWIQTFGGKQYNNINSNDWAKAIIQTNDGSFAIAGYNVSFDRGSDMWLVKTDENGVAQWNKSYGGDGADEAHALIQTREGGFALTGISGSFGVGGGDMWLVRTDANGIMQCSQTYGGTGSDWATSIVQDDDDGFALAGLTASFGVGSGDLWLLKTDRNCMEQFSQAFGGLAPDWASALVQAPDNGYVLAGLTSSFGDTNRDMWLVKIVINPKLDGINAIGLIFFFVIATLLGLSWIKNRK